MSVFKQFLSQDVIVTPFPVNKNFTIFNKAYKELNKPKDLVVDPTNVELH